MSTTHSRALAQIIRLAVDPNLDDRMRIALIRAEALEAYHSHEDEDDYEPLDPDGAGYDPEPPTPSDPLTYYLDRSRLTDAQRQQRINIRNAYFPEPDSSLILAIENIDYDNSQGRYSPGADLRRACLVELLNESYTNLGREPYESIDFAYSISYTA